MTHTHNGILFPKLFWPTERKKMFQCTDQEKLLKFEDEGREFAKFLRTIYQTVIVQTNFLNEIFFYLLLEVPIRSYTLNDENTDKNK